MTDGRAVDRLAVDHAGQVGAGRPDEEAPRLEEEPRAVQQRVAGPRGGDLGDAPAEAGEVERVLVRFVGDPEPATRIDEPDRRTGPPRELASRPDGRGDVRHQGRGVEHVRGAERVQTEQLEMR